MDRGLKGINFILGAMLFNVVPTVFEIALISGILGVKCGLPFVYLTVGTVTLYTLFTFYVTQRRMQFRYAIKFRLNDVSE